MYSIQVVNRGLFVCLFCYPKVTLSAAIVSVPVKLRLCCSWLQFTATSSCSPLRIIWHGLHGAPLNKCAHKFTLLINAQGRSKSSARMYFYFVLLICWEFIFMHLISGCSQPRLSIHSPIEHRTELINMELDQILQTGAFLLSMYWALWI
jgi:hypothetical protein